MNFRQWLENTVGTEEVDSRQIDAIYDKARIAVQLVQLYDQMTGQKFLTNISTIANLPSGAYGLYSSAENRKVIGVQAMNKIRFKFGQDMLLTQKLNQLPNAVIKQYIPDINNKDLQPSDVIHVNVAKIIQQFGDTKEAIFEVASTIIHECQHELELQTTGKTSEIGPVAAEGKFMAWVKTNMKTIQSRIPAIK